MLDKIKKRSAFTADEKAEINAESFFTVMEALEYAERQVSAKGLTRSEIAEIAGIDPSRVTKILGGSERNITLKTLFRMMKAMGRKVFLTSEDYDDLHRRKPNFSFEAARSSYQHASNRTNRYNTFKNAKSESIL